MRFNLLHISFILKGETMNIVIDKDTTIKVLKSVRDQFNRAKENKKMTQNEYIIYLLSLDK